MKKYLLLIALTILTATASAQATFGYFSRDSVLHAMNGYAEASAQLDQLRSQYETEMQRVEEEFNTKYEEFLSDIRELAPAIAQKRQSELQNLMEKNVSFKIEARRLLDEAEREAFGPLQARLSGAVKRLGEERGYDFIINTDADVYPYISPLKGEDITFTLINMLNDGR